MYKLEYRQFFSDFAKLFSKKSLSVYVDDFFSDKEDLGKALFGIKSVRIRVILRWGLYSLLSFAFAFLLCGASIFGTHIFGAALLCALQRFVPQAFFGALLFAVLKLDVPLIISLCLVFFARIGLGIYLYYDMLIYSAEEKIKKHKGYKNDTELTIDDLKDIIKQYKAIGTKFKKPVPQDVHEQL